MESKKTKRNKRMQFWGNDENDDSLIIEILNGQKTATVTSEDKYYEPGGEYDDGGWEIGDIVDVYDLKNRYRCKVRITDVYPVKFGYVPEKLWRGEACKSKKQFQDIHRDCWPQYQLDDEYKLIATHFELVR